MRELNQGEEYVVDDNTSEAADESTENTKSGITHIYGIPKQYVIIGAVVIIAVILVVVLFATRSTGSDDVVIPSVENESDTFFDAGTDDSAFSSGSDTTTSTTNTSSAGGFSSGDDTTSSNTIVEDTNVSSSLNSDETVILLRKLGYTGDEIQLAQQLGLDLQKLISEAQLLREQEAQEQLAKAMDTASPEYQQMYYNSIFCLPKVTFEGFDATADSAVNRDSYYVVNADYEKVPTYGNQLWIKVKIANNTYVFYSITPERYQKLPDSGNIVVKVYYTLYGTNSPNMYVTGIEEISTTDITVNPEDSGSDLDDILDDSDGGYTDDGSDSGGNTGGVWW